MKQRVFVTLVALVVVSLAGSAVAQAQTVSADIAFAFTAGGKELAAGRYDVEVSAAGPVVLSSRGGNRTMLSVVTRLARHAQDQPSAFVFDKVNGKSVLSEIWIPGRDGLLVNATSDPHEHAVVDASLPKK